MTVEYFRLLSAAQTLSDPADVARLLDDPTVWGELRELGARLRLVDALFAWPEAPLARKLWAAANLLVTAKRPQQMVLFAPGAWEQERLVARLEAMDQWFTTRPADVWVGAAPEEVPMPPVVVPAVPDVP